MKSIWLRVRALPRAGQMIVALVAFLALYFLVIEPALDRTRVYGRESDAMEDRLRTQTAVRKRVAESGARLEKTVSLLGQPDLPGGEAERTASMERRINSVLGGHRVANQQTRYREPSALVTDAPESLAGAGQRLDRLVAELSFETDLTTALAVMRELEEAPEICALSKVSLRRTGARGRSEPGSLAVNMTAEAWATSRVAPTRAPRGGNGGGEP